MKKFLIILLIPFVLLLNEGLTADGPIGGGGALPTVEVDPVVGSIAGLVEADGAGNISAATPGTDYYAPGGIDIPITDGGTGQSTAAGAFGALKQDATTAATGVIEIATDAEAVAKAAGDRCLVPSNIPSIMASPGAMGGATPAVGEFLDLGVTDQINLKDGTDTHIIKAVQETGLGGRLTLGLDETARTMAICDAGDVDTDFGLSVAGVPSFFVFDTTAAHYNRMRYNGLLTNTGFILEGGWDITLKAPWGVINTLTGDWPAGNAFTFNSTANIELTDTDGEQSWMYVEPKINQTSTAAWNGLKIKADVSVSEGDGTTGYGNNLILAGTTADEDMFKVDNTGRIVLAESTTPAALADHAFLYAKDTAGLGNMFAADAAAGETELTSHNFSMFPPDPAERFPWSFYAENPALGVKINVDMAGAVRAIEELTGKTFIHYADMETIDLKAAWKAQWEREYIRKNTYEEIVSKDEALEMVQVDERVLYDAEVIDKKTSKKKIVKRGKKIGEKSLGFELVDNEVKEKFKTIWETKKVMKSQLKENVRFEEINGKFYKKIVPTKLTAEVAAVDGFKFAPPAWMADRLKAKVTPIPR